MYTILNFVPDFLDLIRQNLEYIVTIRKQKIRRPVHVSLDKLLMKKKAIDEQIYVSKAYWYMIIL
jgi:hypothetical protein